MADNITLQDCVRLKGPILVIGVSGFIGANLFRSILRYRDDCYGVFNTSPNSWRLSGLPVDKLKKCDLTNYDEVEHLIKVTRPKTIFNLAAYGAYSRQSNVHRIYDTNFMATANLFDCIKDRDISAYIHAGSSSEYGINCNQPKECDRLEPNSDYAVSKVACSYLIQYYGEILKMPVSNLRLYSVYGPWEEPDRLIPKLLLNGLEGKYPEFVNPDISRDFIYVDDASAAFIAAALGIEENKGKSFNIASGRKTTIGNLAEFSRNHFNIPEEPVFSNMENRKWDLADWVGDYTYTKENLNWIPQTPLEDGLAETVKWLRGYSDFYKTFMPDNREIRDKISAIIACYKDAQAIPIMYNRLVETFTKINVDYEIIFVNDCSPDNSEEVILELSGKDPNVIGVCHSRNFGSQSAFLSGMDVGTGNAAVLLDGDLQDPPEIIEQFYQKWKEGYDVIYGERIKREMSPFNEFFYKSFYRVFSFMADIKIPKNAGDFSLMDRKVVNQLLALKERDVFLRGLRAWVGFKQTGIPYVRPERAFGKSTNNLIKNIWWAKKGIFSFSHKPLEYISYLSIVVFFLAFCAGIAQFVIRLYWPELVPPGITTVLLLILFLGGVQLFSISIIGEYIAKIIDETKKRPNYIRNSIITGERKLTEAGKIKEFIHKRR